MNLLVKTVLILSAAFGISAPAFAAPYTSCSNGSIEQVGDGHYQIDIYPDRITFRPYEGSFTIDGVDLDFQDLVYTIYNVKTVLWSEGTKQEVKINANLRFSPDLSELIVAVSENSGPISSYTLKCEKK